MKNNKDDNKKDKKILIGLTSLLVILVIAIVATTFILKNNKDKKDTELAYTDLIKEISEGKIEKVEMTVGSTSIKVKVKDDEKEKNSIVPNTEAFITLVQQKVAEGNQIELIQKQKNGFTQFLTILINFFPTFIMIALFVMIYKMQGLGGEKGKVYEDTERKTKVRFNDVAGLDEEKEELIEIVDFLKTPEKFTKMGAKIPRGVLLYGKPGTGKTLIAKAIAGEANVPFISMSGSEFVEMFVGLGASRVRKLFEKARKLAPCIVFIDEIDAIGARRTGNSGGESENNQTLNQLLVEMDGFSSEETIIVLAATNRPEMLDKALLRPGRFDRQITIPAPDIRGRLEILKIHAKDKKVSDDVNLESIAEDTAGFTGAELANILNEAAIIATINKHEEIENDDIEEAVKKVTVGLEKKERVISDKDKKLTAYHEAGHTIVGLVLSNARVVHKVTIVPRGRAGGYMIALPKEDQTLLSKEDMKEQLAGLMGGRVAEEIIFNVQTTGASNDFEQATQMARAMVTEYGMSEKLGPVQYEGNHAMFGAASPQKSISEQTAYEIDEEVRNLLNEARNKAAEIIQSNREKHKLIAEALLKYETLDSHQIKSLYETGEMPDEPNASSSHALSYDEVKSQMEEQKPE